METERLIIDTLRETDKEAYFRNISHDKKVLETFICQYAESLDTFDFSRYVDKPGLYAIRLKETEKLIGIMVLCDETDSSCEIGYGRVPYRKAPCEKRVCHGSRKAVYPVLF